MGIKVRFTDVIHVYPKLFKAESINGSDPKYSVTFLLDKDKNADAIEAMRSAINDCVEKLGKKPSRVCLVDCDKNEKYTDSDQYDEVYKGKFLVSTYRRGDDTPPVVVDNENEMITGMQQGEIFSGNIVNALIDVYPYNMQTGAGVAASVEGVQKLADGTRIGAARPDPRSMFGAAGGGEAAGSSFDWE